VHIHGLLQKISEGRATTDDLALLEELCQMVKDTSLCGLGQSAPNPVLSTLRFFRNEYEELVHAPEGYVPAGTAIEQPPTR
jgi:bidirectional [NiFe] hydrogenase diaphorase subunit